MDYDIIRNKLGMYWYKIDDHKGQTVQNNKRLLFINLNFRIVLALMDVNIRKCLGELTRSQVGETTALSTKDPGA